MWELISMGGWTHPVHVHLIDFQVLSRNGQSPFPYEMGWKDVLLLSDAEEVEVIARFAPHCGKYMLHCHNTVHEDHDMMTQFEVLELDENGNVVIDKDENGNLPKNAPCELDLTKPLPAAKLGSQPPPDRFKEKPDACSTLPRPSTCPE
jgi:spore coat protein A, manganese oxidase